MEGAFAKYSAFTRIRQELSYGRRAARVIAAKDPAVAVISNVPLLAHSVLARRLARHGVPMVFWHQDIYSEAIGSAARRRLPMRRSTGRLGGGAPRAHDRTAECGDRGDLADVPGTARRLGRRRQVDRCPQLGAHRRAARCALRTTTGGARAGLHGHPVVLYSGTLGLKHDPSVLALIAQRLRESHPDARVVVISEGKGRDWLEGWKRDHGAAADNLVLLDFQPYEDLPAVMGSADVLVAVLEPDASRFSVPSKVLTYLCAGRAIVGVLPPDNSAAEILLSHGAGLVVDPARRDDVAFEVARLVDDEACRGAMGRAGRRYAERAFSPETAADRFVEVFGDLVDGPDGSLVTDTQTVRDLEMSSSRPG